MKIFRFKKNGASLLLATLLAACGGGGGGGGAPLSGTELKLDSPTMVTEVDGVLRPFVTPVGAPSPDPVYRDVTNPASVTADVSTLEQQLTNSATNSLKQLGVDSLVTVSVKTETSAEVANKVLAGIEVNPTININNRSCAIETNVIYDPQVPRAVIESVKNQINATGGDLSQFVTPPNVRQYFYSWLYVPGSVVYNEQSRTATTRFVSTGMTCEEWRSISLNNFYGNVNFSWRAFVGPVAGAVTAAVIRLGLPAAVGIVQPELVTGAVWAGACFGPAVGSVVSTVIQKAPLEGIFSGAVSWCFSGLTQQAVLAKVVAYFGPVANTAAQAVPSVAAEAAAAAAQGVQMTEAAASGVTGVASLGGFASGNQFFQPSVGGMLVAGKFRSQDDVNRMDRNSQRNTLIVEMYNRTKNGVSYYQSLNDDALAGQAALLVALRAQRFRTDADLKLMNNHDIRNTTIVEVNKRTGALYGASRSISELQKLSNLTLAKFALGSHQP